jgi:hypothetical protein
VTGSSTRSNSFWLLATKVEDLQSRVEEVVIRTEDVTAQASGERELVFDRHSVVGSMRQNSAGAEPAHEILRAAGEHSVYEADRRFV